VKILSYLKNISEARSGINCHESEIRFI